MAFVKRMRSEYDRNKLPIWWTEIFLRHESGAEVVADAVVDSGSPFTIVPRPVAEYLIPFELPFDGPVLDTAWGSSKTSPIPVEVRVEGIERQTRTTILVLEKEIPDLDFVIVGLAFLDKAEALLQFGNRREMAGLEDAPSFRVKLLSPYKIRW